MFFVPYVHISKETAIPTTDDGDERTDEAMDEIRREVLFAGWVTTPEEADEPVVVERLAGGGFYRG